MIKVVQLVKDFVTMIYSVQSNQLLMGMMPDGVLFVCDLSQNKINYKY